ncbi:MAG TPA: pitrilysin family protein [Candidatus Binatia bacterium]|nr:pitrilysin family protein [Candidatus Binatia bacterium]
MKKFSLSLIFSLLISLPAPALANMVPQRSVLGNGMILLTSEQRALPMVSIELLIDAGSRHDPPKQEGLANLTARLLTYGTQRRTALEISDTLDFIGAGLSAACGEDLATVSMTVLKKDLGTGLELLAEILTLSTFPQEEIDRQKQSIIASIKAREEDPGDIAQRRFEAALFPQSPYGRPVEGSEASVKGLEQGGLRDFYERYYRPNGAILSVVGDISHQEIAQALNEAFRSWSKGEPVKPPVAPSTIGKAETIRVNKDLTQANIILGHEGVSRENPDYYAIQVMNYILGGGGFSSRALDSIRNERGFAYSVYSYFSAQKSHGTFELVMQTRNETALEAIQIAKAEMRRMRDELVTEEELADAKDYLTGSFPLRLDTNRRVANFLAQVEYFQLGLDYPDRYPDLIRKVTREEVQRVAQTYLKPETLITVIVANQKKIGDQG